MEEFYGFQELNLIGKDGNFNTEDTIKQWMRQLNGQFSTNLQNVSRMPFKAFTSSSTIPDNQQGVVYVNTSSNTTQTIGDPANNSYAVIYIKNISTGTATIAPVSGNIEGAANYSLTAGQGIQIHSDGTNWHILSKF